MTTRAQQKEALNEIGIGTDDDNAPAGKRRPRRNTADVSLENFNDEVATAEIYARFNAKAD